MVLREDSTPEPIDDFALAYRRWLASRFYRWWFRSGKAIALPTESELGPLSDDMAAALRGLRRELDERPGPIEPPGFRGPDKWYARSAKAMTETWRTHLLALVQNPDADEPRLADAECMRAQDPDLARFIELQVAAGRERRRKRTGRFGIFPSEDRTLLEKNRERWTHTIAKYTARQELHRGFIAEIAMNPYMFLEYGDWVLKNAPIRMVEFGWPEEGPFPVPSCSTVRCSSVSTPSSSSTGV